MTHSLRIPLDAFFEPCADDGRVAEVLDAAATGAAAVRIGLSPDAVLFETVADDVRAIRLEGWWRTPDLRGLALDEAAPKVVLPFVFDTAAITLPRAQVLPVALRYRSAADFALRSLFLAACRNAPATVVETRLPDTLQRAADRVRMQYFHIVTAILGDPALAALSAPEAMELFLADAYLPVLDVAHPVLRRGGDCLRRACADRASGPDTAGLMADILAQRARMAVHF